MILQGREKKTRTILVLQLWGREFVVRDPRLELRILKEFEICDVRMTLKGWWVSRIP